MTLTPDADEHFVLVWREPKSLRLRTYVNLDGHPVSSPLDKITPTPTKIVRDASTFESWLTSPATEETVAVSETLALSELGWKPQREQDPNA